MFAFGTSPIEHLRPKLTRALLAEAAFQGADLRFFSAADCEPGAARIRASRWTGEGWKTEEASLPPLVVILTNPVKDRHRETGAWLRAETRTAGFHNFTKLELDAIVRASPWAEYAIPCARLDPARVREQLGEWLGAGAAVVKPDDGLRGSNIHFALPEGDRWVLSRGEETWQGTPGELAARIENNIRGRLRYRDFLVQRYIDSRDVDGRPAAIRVDLMRRPEAGWNPFRFTARLAGTNRLTSNVMSGGSDTSLESFLARRKVRDSRELREEVLALATGIADTLNANLGTESNFAYGVDIVIDADDRLWFIEANGQPMAIGLEHDYAIGLIAYLLWLTG
jgi:hypothetical protein